MDRHADKFCVSVSIGTLKSDKLLKIPSARFNLRQCNFSKFPEGHAPDSPSAGMLCTL